MGTITFSRLRDSEDWGLRGTKESSEDQPPEEGGMVTVTKKSGEQQEVQMGRVVAQGDDWWLATSGASNNTATCRSCACDSCVSLMAKVKRLVAGMDDQVVAAIPEGHPKPNLESSNYTERRLAREAEEDKLATEASATEASATEANEENPWT